MGYRSAVAYVVAFGSNDQPEKAHIEYLQFQAWVKQLVTDSEVNPGQPETYDYTNAMKDFNTSDGWAEFKWYPENNMLIFRVDHAKWYPEYPDVKWHETVVEQANEYSTAGYRFVRIGEEYDDIETREENASNIDLFEYVDVCRTVEVSRPSEQQNKEAV